MKKALLFSAVITLVALLAVSTTSCSSSSGFSRVTPEPSVTPTPTPSPDPAYGTHLFAFLRDDGTGADSATLASREELLNARRQTKLDHATTRQVPITVDPDAVNIYVWPFHYREGWYPGTERKITGSPGGYTSVHLSLNDTDIVFTRVVNGYTQIFTNTVPADGLMTTAPVQLTGDPEHHWLPHISDDGSKVIFTKFDAASNGDLVCVIANAPGSDEECLNFSATTPVLKGANLWHAAWGPEAKIVFEAWGGPLASDEIFSAGEDGTGLTQITNNAATRDYDECPSMYHEGRGLAVATWKDATQRYEINEIDLSTNTRYTITEPMSGDAWDPLFTYYALVWVGQSDGDTRPQLYVMSYSPIRISNGANANYFADH